MTPFVCNAHFTRLRAHLCIPGWLQAAGFSGDSGMTGPYVFVSMPMFCGADPSLAADAGLTCDMDKHMTWVDVEPNTGEQEEACWATL